jgi:hypothetical protein
MNAFEPLLWMACAWCVLRSLRTGDPRWWLLTGVLTGVGMEMKYSILFFIAGILIGLALTPERRFLRSKWFWLGTLAALLIFLPHLLWLIHNHFPFLEYEHNVRMTDRDVRRGPLSFLLDQAGILNPLSAPIWIAGALWLLLTRSAKPFRILGWTFLAVLVLFIALHAKNYYVVPVYPMVFAAGAIALERVVMNRWLRGGYFALLALSGIMLAPLTLPVLSPQTYLRYQKALGIAPPKAENQPTGPLPQYFADEFGWEEMVRKTAEVYNSLPPEERDRTAIFANDWGEAAAVDFFGPRYGLPRAVSPHNSYWLWGPHGYDGSTVIVLGSNGSGDREHFRSVAAAGEVSDPWSRTDEHFTIWLCRGLRWDLRAEWPKLKHWG